MEPILEATGVCYSSMHLILYDKLGICPLSTIKAIVFGDVQALSKGEFSSISNRGRKMNPSLHARDKETMETVNFTD